MRYQQKIKQIGKSVGRYVTLALAAYTLSNGETSFATQSQNNKALIERPNQKQAITNESQLMIFPGQSFTNQTDLIGLKELEMKLNSGAIPVKNIGAYSIPESGEIFGLPQQETTIKEMPLYSSKTDSASQNALIQTGIKAYDFNNQTPSVYHIPRSSNLTDLLSEKGNANAPASAKTAFKNGNAVFESGPVRYSLPLLRNTDNQIDPTNLTSIVSSGPIYYPGFGTSLRSMTAKAQTSISASTITSPASLTSLTSPTSQTSLPTQSPTPSVAPITTSSFTLQSSFQPNATSAGSLVLKPTYWNIDGTSAGTNLFTDTQYIVRLQLDTTPNPSEMIKDVKWTINMNTGYVNFVSSELPSQNNPSTNTNDFFFNIPMDGIFNFVATNRNNSGDIGPNERLISTSISYGPSNTVGFLAEYDIIFTKAVTNRAFLVSGVGISDMNGDTLTYNFDQNRFNVINIPEPSSLFLTGAGLLAALGVAGSRRRKAIGKELDEEIRRQLNQK